MITWCVNGMGGRIYSGIPSQDVAIIMAVDLERYVEDDEDDHLVRVEVGVDLAASEYDGDPTFIHVCADGGRGLTSKRPPRDKRGGARFRRFAKRSAGSRSETSSREAFTSIWTHSRDQR